MTVDSGWAAVARASIEDALTKALERERIVPRLREAVAYSVFPAGKRLRPLLAVGFCSDLGGDPSRIIGSAAALEFLHCSSLVHDDLPALDNDDMRRGKPACHRAFGEATALLAGDIAISEAITLALEDRLEMSGLVEVANEISRAYSELCSGQQLDLLPPPERGDILTLYARKTGALFGAAFAIGAIGARKPVHFIDSSRSFGVQLGILFQLQDDRIDAQPEKGRDSASDTRNRKATASATEDPARFNKIRLECADALEALERESASLARVRSLTSSFLAAA